ncbi:fumarate hydratase C-terminal domain-containing protein [Methanobacterium sp.]|uniref:fumarate hydratase C-terminal domain-containing protein n=1 Tax=Methanobacterium sp. TaxID=2164 RepID=UPI003C729EA4
MITKIIKTPVTPDSIEDLKVGDRIEIHGKIFTGRDAALPKLIKSIKNGEKLIDIKGSAIMHTAVSDAGISPTTSNKEEIEESIPYLSKEGVKVHIGKGNLSEETIKALDKWGSIFVVTPPAAALLTSKVISRRVAAFEEEGMEAIYELDVDGLPGIVAVAHGKSIY